jgi:hypothetical protein
MGRYIITKRHLTTLYVFLDAHTDLLNDFEKDLKRHNISNLKLLLFVKLLGVPTPKWVSREEETISNIVSYMLWKTIKRMDDFTECVRQLEKRAKDEYKRGVMTKEFYLEHRRTNLDLINLLEALIRTGGDATMTFDNWEDKNEDRVNIEV